MLRIASALTGAALLAACASQPLPPPMTEPDPPLPAVLLDAPLQMESVAEAAPPPPPPEAPPPPEVPVAPVAPEVTSRRRAPPPADVAVAAASAEQPPAPAN